MVKEYDYHGRPLLLKEAGLKSLRIQRLRNLALAVICEIPFINANMGKEIPKNTQKFIGLRIIWSTPFICTVPLYGDFDGVKGMVIL